MLDASPSVLRKYLEEYGLSSELTQKIAKEFRTVNSFLHEDDKKLSEKFGISQDEISKMKEYIKDRHARKELVNDFLARWGRASSQEDLKRAYEEYEKLTQLYPNSPAIWGIKGELLEKMNRREDARKAYKKAYQLHIKRGELPPPELERKIKEMDKKKALPPAIPNGLDRMNIGMINGFKNGLINGSGLVNGVRSPPPSGRERKGPWRFMISLIIILLVIFAPLMATFLLEKRYVYRVDGNFEEWSIGIPYYSLKKASRNINIEYAKFHPADNGIYFYIKMEGRAFENVTGLYIFLDTDGSKATGYRVSDLGADYMVELFGWNNTLKGKSLYFFNSTDQNDFSGFHYLSSVPAVLKGNNIEGFMKVPSAHFSALVVSYNYAFSEDIAPCVFYGKKNFIVEEQGYGGIISLFRESPLLKMNFFGEKIHVSRITFELYGTANFSNQKYLLYLDNGNGILDSQDSLISSNYQLLAHTLVFSNLNLSGSNFTLFLSILPKNSVGKTVGAKIEALESNMPYYLDSSIIQATYIGKVPASPRIDGSFLDWKNVKRDAARDVISSGKIKVLNSNIDLLNYSAYNASSLLIYLQVRGRLLGGTDIPKVEIPSLPDSDRDTVPDKFDLYPHDFNNDGIPDNESYVIVNGMKYPDVDGDGIPDYPYGNDMWLNTTIPSNFPKPYAGRHVSVYIGPVPHRKVYGMDTISIFIDSDGNKSTGFSLPQYPFGAEYKIELVGRDGRIFESSLYTFQNGSWVFLRTLSPKDYALGYHAIELASHLPGKNILIALSDWMGNRDVSDESFSVSSPVTISTRFNLTAFLSNSRRFDEKSYNVKTINPEYLGRYSNLKSLFGEDVQVSTLGNSNKRNEVRPSIVRTDDGTLWVVWSFERKNGKHDIAIAKSTDDGATWDAWKLYNNRNYDTSNPVIVKDSSDDLYVFFENHTSGATFQIFKYSSAAQTWTLYGYTNSSWWSSVYNLSAAAYSNYLFLAFEYHNSSSNSTIGYMVTFDAGNSWSGAIFTTHYWTGHPAVTISSGSEPRVFIAFDYQWTLLILKFWQVGVVYANITDLAWNTADPYQGFWLMRYPSIYATGDTIYMAADYQLRYIYVAVSTDNGNTWNVVGSPDLSQSSSGSSLYPWILADGENVYIFYLNATTGYVCMVSSSDGGSSWNQAILVSDSGTGVNIYRTLSAIYSGGKLYVVWTDSRNGQNDIYFDKVPEFGNFVFVIMPLLLISLIISRRRKRK